MMKYSSSSVYNARAGCYGKGRKEKCRGLLAVHEHNVFTSCIDSSSGTSCFGREHASEVQSTCYRREGLQNDATPSSEMLWKKGSTPSVGDVKL